jgi:hypothetical protein
MFSCWIVCVFLFVLGSVVVSVLAIGPKVCGFEPGRGQWIVNDDKNPQHAIPLERK